MSKIIAHQRFFAASNSSRGFCNYFDSVFSTAYVDHLYIIKGGPGTGKSYFMNLVARRAVGAGYAVTEYACSSDPASLDGLILRKKGCPTIGFLDGTAPHAADVNIPGVREELIDLGVFWDASILLCDRESIAEHTAAKAAAYADAYAHLRAAGEMEAVTGRLVDRVIHPERVAAVAARIHRGLPSSPAETAGTTKKRKITVKSTVDLPGKTGRSPWMGDYQTGLILSENEQNHDSHAFVSPSASTEALPPPIALRRALGMTGWVTLPTYERMANTVVIVGDGHTPAERMVAARVLGCIYDASLAQGNRLLVSRDPVYPVWIDGLFCDTPNGGVAVLAGGTLSTPEAEGQEASMADEISCRTVSIRRCVDTEALRAVRPELRRVDALRERHEEEAVRALSRAHEAHFALEAIYTAAMDIPAKEAFTRAFCGRLFGDK